MKNREESYLPTLTRSGIIFVLLAVALGAFPSLTSQAEPTVTGDAPADFIAADAISIPDPDGVDNVVLPPTGMATQGARAPGWPRRTEQI